VTPEAAALVRTGWSVLAPDADGFADRFITRLLEHDPSLGVLVISSGRATAARSISQTFARIVEAVEEPGPLVGLLATVGRTLVERGIEARDYDVARTALFVTLSEMLRDELTPEMDDAWHELFALASAVSQRVAHSRTTGS
jgi:hemoglobin-like flavoprotein